MPRYRISRTLYLLLVLGTTLACDDDSGGPVVKNCRITEMYYDDALVGHYSYKFHYNNDGTLKLVTTPNVSISYKYSRGKLKMIEQNGGGQVATYTYEYPTENLITWTSTSRNRVSELYHTGYKVDSLLVFDVPATNTSVKFHSYPNYSGNNVKTINSSGGCCFYSTEDIVYNIDDVEYDSGLNPSLLWLKSVGALIGQDIMTYDFVNFSPEHLSENNPTSYKQSGSYNNFFRIEYTYETPGSYPLTLTRYYDGGVKGYTYNFVYENCD